MIRRRLAGGGFILALAGAVVVCAFGAASLALRRPPVARLHTQTASALRADYSADPRGRVQAPLSPAIIADAAQDAGEDAKAGTPTAPAGGSQPRRRGTAVTGRSSETPSADNSAPFAGGTPVPRAGTPGADASPGAETTARPGATTTPRSAATSTAAPADTPAPVATKTPTASASTPVAGKTDNSGPSSTNTPQPANTPRPAATPTRTAVPPTSTRTPVPTPTPVCIINLLGIKVCL